LLDMLPSRLGCFILMLALKASSKATMADTFIAIAGQGSIKAAVASGIRAAAPALADIKAALDKQAIRRVFQPRRLQGSGRKLVPSRLQEQK